MFQRTLLFMITMASALVSCASNCPTTNVISPPPAFQWTFHPATTNNPEPCYSGTLEYGEVTLSIGGEILNTRAYRQEGGA